MIRILSPKIRFSLSVLIGMLLTQPAISQDPESEFNPSIPKTTNEPAFCDGWRKYRDGEFFQDYNRILNDAGDLSNIFEEATTDAQRILDEMTKWGGDGFYSAEFLGSGKGEAWLQTVNFVKLAADGIYDTLSVIFFGGAATSIKLTAQEQVLKHTVSGVKIADSFANSHTAIAAAKVAISLEGPVGATIVGIHNAYENAERFETTDDGIKEMKSIITNTTEILMSNLKQAADRYNTKVDRLDSLNSTREAFDGLCTGSQFTQEDESDDESLLDLIEKAVDGTAGMADQGIEEGIHSANASYQTDSDEIAKRRRANNTAANSRISGSISTVNQQIYDSKYGTEIGHSASSDMSPSEHPCPTVDRKYNAMQKSLERKLDSPVCSGIAGRCRCMIDVMKITIQGNLECKAEAPPQYAADIDWQVREAERTLAGYQQCVSEATEK